MNHAPERPTLKLTPSLVSVVVIDPQVGFYSPAGTLGRKFGAEEFAPMRDVMQKLGAFLAQLPQAATVIFVTSEYPYGLHTQGDQSDPLSLLCVPGMSDDCRIADEITMEDQWTRIVKTSVDVFDNIDFSKKIEQSLSQERQAIIVCGFTLTTCIRRAVLGLCERRSGALPEILMLSDLVGARLSTLKAEDGQHSLAQAVIDELKSSGAVVLPSVQIQFE